MLGRILFDVFLFIVPFALYAGWLSYLKRRHERDPNWREAPWTRLTIVGLVLVALSFVVLRIVEGDNGPATYVPARLEDGRIVPGELKR
jgi:membrane protease YdiL (CAAX protease family)